MLLENILELISIVLTIVCGIATMLLVFICGDLEPWTKQWAGQKMTTDSGALR